jgi:hypothetical protein
MANNAVVTSISLFIDKVKVGESTGGTIKFNNGVSRTIVTDGIALMVGQTVSDLSFKTVIPRAGMKARIFEAVFSKKDVTAQFVMDSKSYAITGKMSDGSADWDSNGKLEGSFDLVAGEPTVI